MAGPMRRKKPIVSRRRVEDEEGEEGGHELDEDSLSEGSITDDENADNASESSHLHPDTESPILSKAATNGYAKANSLSVQESTSTRTASAAVKSNGTTDTEMMLNGLNLTENRDGVEAVNYEDLQNAPKAGSSQPVIVKSSAAMDQPLETPLERRRREHEDYKKKRDEDPAFVPNRGAFFMHDHRHAGPAANGFRPFGRGRGRGGRGGIGGPFAPVKYAENGTEDIVSMMLTSDSYMQQMAEPTDAPWTHDMHDAVLEDNRGPRQQAHMNASASRHSLPQAPRGPAPNRALSTTKHIGNVQVRIFLPGMETPIMMPAIAIHQYTRLPDHRPPLRRDKPVRISLPDTAPRYIFPAVERSFIFIPRAMRPNQQGFGSRSNRARQGLGSIGGFSRRTSVYGGSVYGSAYTPSVAMSRRSSLAHEIPRDSIISPIASTMSRPPIPIDTARPVVRLPPSMAQMQPAPVAVEAQQPEEPITASPAVSHTYPAPQKPTFRENRPNSIPMQHPRPQKAVSVDNIESPAALQYNPPQQYQQPFHHQVPAQVNGHGYGQEPHLHLHSRTTSYQGSTGTPLSQIPERAIHAQPFQPNVYQQQQGFYGQQYPMMPQQQGYYYPQQYNGTMAAPAPAFVPAPPQQSPYVQPAQIDTSAQAGQQAGLVAQEVNGMVYYYDAAQIPAVATFPAYAAPQVYPMQQMGGMAIQHGMITPSPDGFYYAQPAQAVVYYPQ